MAIKKASTSDQLIKEIRRNTRKVYSIQCRRKNSDRNERYPRRDTGNRTLQQVWHQRHQLQQMEERASEG